MFVQLVNVMALSWPLALNISLGIVVELLLILFLFTKLTSWKETYINIMIQLKMLLTWSQFIKTILTKLSLKTLKRLLWALK